MRPNKPSSSFWDDNREVTPEELELFILAINKEENFASILVTDNAKTKEQLAECDFTNVFTDIDKFLQFVSSPNNLKTNYVFLSLEREDERLKEYFEDNFDFFYFYNIILLNAKASFPNQSDGTFVLSY